MSSNLVDKLDIDVVVTLGVHGPIEAGSWSSWRTGAVVTWPVDPDELGTMLWQTNGEAVLDLDEGDEPVPSYHYQRVPCPVTAVEGLKALSYYRYQTADDPEWWGATAAAAYCAWLQLALIRVLPGFDEAPWGWDESVVEARRRVE